MSIDQSFADYSCELLQSAGPCVARRMFGGWGISVDGMTIAILANLGDGDTLWLKASDESRHRFEAEGCARFTYPVQGQPKSMNYYSTPAEAMESPALMLPWARLAMEAALQARKPVRPKAPTKKATRGRPKPPPGRPKAA
ncbi:TfoX/Sxy family protein [Rhodoferax sp.]|uniref:TfoX/Sxy family protein n=1 Tax=Rhodoferax sp. TaxID=50421 RepID=UPI002ACD809E|nr:TfoX/Sxy family protein [Rhodoferax sp.]MDZ7920386.1 TfoX/Sxy family protein [Rhodoferax sp.]